MRSVFRNCLYRRNACRPGQELGRKLTTAVARNAKVFSFGDGSQGALGHTECFGGDAYEPESVPGLPEDITSVGAGHYHSMAVTQSGHLWAWGRNSEGQLGERDSSLLSREKWHVPQRVRGLENVEVTHARGSGVVSMALGRDGSLWAWGKSKRGQLGLGPGIIHAPTPQRVDALAGKRVIQVALGWGHALALTAEGHVYSWGYAAHGRLGFQPHGTPSSSPSSKDGADTGEDMEMLQVLAAMEKEKSAALSWEPVRVDALQSHHVTQISCGLDHSLTLNGQGELWSFGDNSLGQLGRRVAIPTTGHNNEENDSGVGQVHMREERVVCMGAGLGHSLAVQEQGRVVYSWGWNAGHQLGRDHDDTSLPAAIEFEELSDQVVALSGGRAHSVALTSAGELWTWGSGKNGRLGLGSPADEPYPFPLQSLCSIAEFSCGFDHTLLLLPDK